MFENQKVAFLATGGGSKGVAHAGVMQACETLGIKFDILIGASAGAIAVVYYNQHKNIDQVIDHFRPKRKRRYDFEQFSWKKLLSFKNFFNTNIKSGVFDLSAGEEFFRRTLKINDFDQLDTPLYISATNLDTNSGILFGPEIKPKVPISTAIVASCCVPMLFRPVKIGNHYYVDGEIKRPMSIQSAIDFGADVVIVSDMYAPCVKNIGQSSMFNIAAQIANMMLEDKSYRGIQFCQVKNPGKKVILVSPATGDLSTFSLKHYKKLVNAGYNATIKAFQDSGDI
jgi:NTE family protein